MRPGHELYAQQPEEREREVPELRSDQEFYSLNEFFTTLHRLSLVIRVAKK